MLSSDTVDEKPSGSERRDKGFNRGSERSGGERSGGGDRGSREQFANRRSPERQEVEPAPTPEAAAEALFKTAFLSCCGHFDA